MSGLFDSHFAATGRELLQSVLGGAPTGQSVALAYTAPEGGAAVDVAEAIWTPEEQAEQPGRDGLVIQDRVTVQVRASYFTAAAPAVNGTVTRAGEAWTVERVLPLPGECYELTVVRSNPDEKSHENYRLRR
ncbi:MAG TPA: hypothetical protein PK280_20805 [Planctomycetota bacterium]|nr:hypothetical protein [Planctomycetota bacterium]